MSKYDRVKKLYYKNCRKHENTVLDSNISRITVQILILFYFIPIKVNTVSESNISSNDLYSFILTARILEINDFYETYRNMICM